MGRTKGTKNKAGHRAGGARKGAGRKPKAREDMDSLQSIIIPQLNCSIVPDLPQASNSSPNHSAPIVFESATAPVPMQSHQPSPPISRYASSLPQLSLEAAYVPESQTTLAAPSRLDATHTSISATDPYATLSDFGNILGFYPSSSSSTTPYSEGDAPHSSSFTGESPHQPQYNLATNDPAGYSPHSPLITPYPSPYGFTRFQTLESPTTQHDVLLEPWSKQPIPTSYRAESGTTFMSPGSAPSIVFSPAQSVSDFEPSPYRFPMPLTQPLPMVSLPSPSTYTPPLPQSMPLPPKPLMPISPFPSSPSEISQQSPRLTFSAVEPRRRQRRCVSCVELGRGKEAYKCPGRGGRDRCPDINAVRSKLPPLKPLSTPRITVSSGDLPLLPSSAAESYQPVSFGGELTGALQMAGVSIPQQPFLSMTSYETQSKRPRCCVVCKQNGKKGDQCPGRGNRSLCPNNGAQNTTFGLNM